MLAGYGCALLKGGGTACDTSQRGFVKCATALHCGTLPPPCSTSGFEGRVTGMPPGTRELVARGASVAHVGPSPLFDGAFAETGSPVFPKSKLPLLPRRESSRTVRGLSVVWLRVARAEYALSAISGSSSRRSTMNPRKGEMRVPLQRRKHALASRMSPSIRSMHRWYASRSEWGMNTGLAVSGCGRGHIMRATKAASIPPCQVDESSLRKEDSISLWRPHMKVRYTHMTGSRHSREDFIRVWRVLLMRLRTDATYGSESATAPPPFVKVIGTGNQQLSYRKLRSSSCPMISTSDGKRFRVQSAERRVTRALHGA